MKYHATPGVIAAGHPETARAGSLMLEAGGNAYDAVLAAFLAACVCEPTLTSLGGGGFLNVYTANRKKALYDFFVQTPFQHPDDSRQDFRESEIRFGTARQLQFIGRATVATPGTVAGIFKVHRDLGSLPLSVIAEPAIELAENGVIISDYQAFTFGMLEEVLLDNAAIRAIFAPSGKLLVAGDKMVQGPLASTLDWLINEGEREFYEGEIARLLLADHEEYLGSIRAHDLRSYAVIARNPLAIPLGSHTLLTNPTPSEGGTLLAASLKILQERPYSLTESDDPARLRALVNAIQGMMTFREKYLTPVLEKHPGSILSYASVAEALQGLNLWGNTTHISVLDQQGNAASLTASLGAVSGAVIPGTGITLNNMLGELDLLPHGPGSWQTNRRVGSMMSPSILLEGDTPKYVLGTGGSSRIRTAMLQVVDLLVRVGLSPEDAILHPRLHWEKQTLHLEPGLSTDGWDLPGIEKVVPWEELNMFFGGVHLAGLDTSGYLTGMADPRRNGAWIRVE